MTMPALAALWFLPFVAAIAVWVSISDMKVMKIPNVAVLGLVAVFLVVGPFVLPLQEWGFRWLHLAVVLVIGFLLNLIQGIGAGDAKLAAAIAPFVAFDDIGKFFLLMSAVSIGAVIFHRTLRSIPAVRRATPDWQSWNRRRDFPMGLALGATLTIYLILAAIY
jgi:prepilin peptidase CpaA